MWYSDPLPPPPPLSLRSGRSLDDAKLRNLRRLDLSLSLSLCFFLSVSVSLLRFRLEGGILDIGAIPCVPLGTRLPFSSPQTATPPRSYSVCLLIFFLSFGSPLLSSIAPKKSFYVNVSIPLSCSQAVSALNVALHVHVA